MFMAENVLFRRPTIFLAIILGSTFYYIKGKNHSGAKFFYTKHIFLNKAHSTKWKAFDNKTLHLYNHSLYEINLCIHIQVATVEFWFYSCLSHQIFLCLYNLPFQLDFLYLDMYEYEKVPSINVKLIRPDVAKTDLVKADTWRSKTFWAVFVL